MKQSEQNKKYITCIIP